jgi:hypothetical protein
MSVLTGDAPELEQFYGESFYTWQRDGSRRSAAEILPYVFGLLSPRSVCDLGCGTGAWLAVAKALGAEVILGIDGPHVDPKSLLIAPSQFVPHDLSTKFRCERRFDLAISLETAEHLDGTLADEFVESLVNLAPVLLFSAAGPGQGGNHHVNEQWPSYWIAKFSEHSYATFDCIRPFAWDCPRIEWWYAQNTFLIVSRSYIARFPGIAGSQRFAHSPMVNLVHPRRVT